MTLVKATSHPSRPGDVRSGIEDDGEEPLTPTEEQQLNRTVVQAFAPLYKAAFGIATGVVFGAGLALVTLLAYLIDPNDRVGLWLLTQYFYGYSVSPVGALIALAWGSIVGFIAGWFMAFARNAVMAIWLLYIRARAEWRETRDLLDYV